MSLELSIDPIAKPSQQGSAPPCVKCGQGAVAIPHAVEPNSFKIFGVIDQMSFSSDGLCHTCTEKAKHDGKSEAIKRIVHGALAKWAEATPDRYKAACFMYVPESRSSKIKKWLDNKESSFLVFWSNTPGPGKTYTAYAVCRWLIENNYLTPMFVVVPELVCMIRDEISKGKHTTVENVRSHRGLLILDDMGAEVQSEFITAEYYRILDYRDRWQLKTLITTNLEPEDWDERLSSRIASRIKGGVVAYFSGTDRRKDSGASDLQEFMKD
jgi:chromosomal replication initiation ATPase DnaA